MVETDECQLSHQRVQRDADDGGVEDHGEVRHQDEAGLDDLRVDLAVVSTPPSSASRCTRW